MADRTVPTAEPFIPHDRSLASLAAAARTCSGCDLYRDATQTVFGEGPAEARLMLVGEQPGDREDIEGHPFVGPAGRVLHRALTDLHVSGESYYVTNAVKHFKWRPAGKRRIHETPRASEMRACLPWLEAEIEALRPAVIVLLGATAVATLLGSSFKVGTHRGKIVESAYGACLVTTHPSSILRSTSQDQRDAAYGRFLDDLRAALVFLERQS